MTSKNKEKCARQQKYKGHNRKTKLDHKNFKIGRKNAMKLSMHNE